MIKEMVKEGTHDTSVTNQCILTLRTANLILAAKQ